jgi:hypothetical protein
MPIAPRGGIDRFYRNVHPGRCESPLSGKASEIEPLPASGIQN